jgi:hypothetical protein
MKFMLLFDLCVQPSDKIIPIITLYCKAGNLIISLSCFEIKPTPTEESKLEPQGTKYKPTENLGL